MEILLDIDICKGLTLSDNFEVSDPEKKRIKNAVDFDNVTSAEYVNIGPGADYIVLLLVISIGIQLIKLGSTINDGIDGWIGIGKKIKKLYRRNKIISIDIEGATALSIELIAKKVDIDYLEKIQETTINLVNVSGMIPINKGLSQKPHNYYIQAYRVNGLDIYVVGIKSNGEAEIIKHFEFNPYGVTEVE